MTAARPHRFALLVPAILVLAGCGQNGGQNGGPSGSTPSGLTGETRAQFLQGAVASCTAKGATDPATASIPQATILAYCTCSSNALADRLTPDDIAAINADPDKGRAMVAPRVQAAAQACKSVLRGS